MGAVIARDHVAEPFLDGDASFLHGFTFAGHPMCAAVALANIDVFEREDLLQNVLDHEADLRTMLDSMRDIPVVGDVRGAGYFQAMELVKDQATKERFTPDEHARILAFLSRELLDRGLIFRADDRSGPVIQLAPPLIAGPEHFAEMEALIRPVVEQVAAEMV
jgi:adenosylmethionine-8-amino-7-oxononanoate aminotransferase